MIEHLESHIVYENPKPKVRSRHGYFPGVVQLPSVELLALFVMGEAFESADQETYVCRSKDLGRTWQLQGPLYDKSRDLFPTSDYFKPQLLRDGSLLALGYRFHRHDPEQSIAIEETDGALPGDNVVSVSTDEGRTWSVPRVIPRGSPELLEIPSRSLQLHSGDIVATAGLFKMPDGSNPSGQFGVLLRSRDNGQTWNDQVHFFESPGKTVAAYESHLCEMQLGRLAAICWAFDLKTGQYLSNQVSFSHDNGHRWSAPIDTGHMGQSANLLYLGGERLLSIHCHRGQEVGLYVRQVDCSNDQWKPLEEKIIWGTSMGQQTRDGQKFHEFASSIRFGQASLLRLGNGEILATHWCVIEGQGKIITHRLRVSD
ncbi:MAG: exo-alpha-sialidase [Acidobacteria bacterium]|nr:exo-alpha-sialidase [Acidobacteriota bacterium]